MKNTEKFSGKSTDYEKYRSGYPKELFQFLKGEINFSKEHVVADIGAGTGIFTKELIDNSRFVFAVEPNEEMHQKCSNTVKGFENCEVVAASGEGTTLDDSSIDFITVAQAYHWLDEEKAKKEFQRILKPNGKVILVWNSRDSRDEFVQENDLLFQRLCPSYSGFSGGEVEDHGMFKRLYKQGNYIERHFENHLYLTLGQFIGRSLSASYAPLQGDEGYEIFIKELTHLFNKYSENGILFYQQFTRVYVGEV